MIDLRCCTAAELLAEGLPEPPRLIIADPAWGYDNAAGGSMESGSAAVYETMTEEAVADDLSAAYRAAAEDAYLGLWCTGPKLREWFQESLQGFPWRYLGLGGWVKDQRQIGMGFHWRGHLEPVLLYAKGAPKPCGTVRSAWTGSRRSHSEKLPEALDDLLRLGTVPGDLVVELYAGETASGPLSAQRMGRRYLGCESSSAGWMKARERLLRASAPEPVAVASAACVRVYRALGRPGETVVMSSIPDSWPPTATSSARVVSRGAEDGQPWTDVIPL